MRIPKALIALLISLLVVICATEDPRKSTIPTSERIKRFATRNKRSLLLPKNGSIKLTVALGQALVASSPKGLSLSWEISDYYSGLTTFKDWLNEAPHQHDTKSKVKTGISQTSLKNYFYSTDGHNLPLDSYVNKPLDMRMSVLTKPNQYVEQRQRNLNHSQLNNKYSSPELINHWSQLKRKRSLEDTIINLLGTNFKCVILKSICTSEQFLLPPGFSMSHDIIRIMFLNTDHVGSGEVGSNLCDSETMCDTNLKSGQYFNILDWLLHPMKIGKI